ncbi:MAG: 1,4-dihydroxy-2-naphthoyl-CoA synthase [Scrofimicrobium sp.]
MSSQTIVSDTFDPSRWKVVPGFDFSDITYHRGISRGEDDGATKGAELPWVRVAFNRPEVRNAFRPQTVDELLVALDDARTSSDVAAVIITGNGPSPRDGGYAFSSGGDQRVRGKDGYMYSPSGDSKVDRARAGRLHILEVQRLIRAMPKPVIAAVGGWAAGGGHSLAVVCDLAVASKEHAMFMQTDANVGSFDAGYGSALLARQVGDRRAREIFFLSRPYTAEQAENWGAINEAVPHDRLEETAISYCRTVATKSPQAIRMLKYAFNLADDGLAGQQMFAGEATRLAYMTDEAREGRDAFLEHRDPDWSDFPYHY